jgi:hypothetical protein
MDSHTSDQWRLTATFARISSVERTLGDHRFNVLDNSLSASGDSSSEFSDPHQPSRSGPKNQIREMKRGDWDDDEDEKLIQWRLDGWSWPSILEKFPYRTEAAVKSHWYVVLAPQHKSKSTKKR